MYPPAKEFHFRIFLTLDLLHVGDLEGVADAYAKRFRYELLRKLQEEKAKSDDPGNVVEPRCRKCGEEFNG